MKILSDKKWFSIGYFLLAALSFNSLTGGYRWMFILTVIIALWGTGILCWRILHWKEFRSVPLLIGCVLFLISYFISSLCSISYGIIGNVQALAWMAFQLLILYPDSSSCDVEYRKNRIEQWSLAVIIYTALQAVISIGMLLLVYQGKAIDRGMYIGIQSGRLWGAYADPNYGAVLAVASIILTLGLLRRKEISGWRRKSLIWNLIFQYLYIVFSYSRTGQICFGIGLILFFVYWCASAKPAGKQRIGVFLAILLLCFSSGALRDLYNYCYQSIDVYAAEGEAGEGEEVDSMFHREEELSEDVSNGRFSIWKDGIQIWRDNPVFGISYRNVSAYLSTNMPDSHMASKEVPMNTFHNVVMDVLVSQGLLGLLIFIGMAAGILRRSFRMFGHLQAWQWSYAAPIGSVLVVIMAGAMFLSDIFYINTPTAVLFWICLGEWMAFSGDVRKNKYILK